MHCFEGDVLPRLGIQVGKQDLEGSVWSRDETEQSERERVSLLQPPTDRSASKAPIL
jgi:hypothetical protein